MSGGAGAATGGVPKSGGTAGAAIGSGGSSGASTGGGGSGGAAGGNAGGAAGSGGTTGTQIPNTKVVMYLPNWSGSFASWATKVDFTKMTHLNLAFGTVK